MADAAPSIEERLSAHFSADEPSESPPNDVAEESEQDHGRTLRARAA